jgi:hypothetical protein
LGEWESGRVGETAHYLVQGTDKIPNGMTGCSHAAHSPWFSAKAELHPEAIFDETTPIGAEGVPDGTLKGDRCTGSYVDLRQISLVFESQNKFCGFDPGGTLSGLTI